MRIASVLSSRVTAAVAASCVLLLAGCSNDSPPVGGNGTTVTGTPLVSGGAATAYTLNYPSNVNVTQQVNVPIGSAAATALSLPTGFVADAIAFDPNTGVEYVAGALYTTSSTTGATVVTPEVLVFPANSTSFATPTTTILGVVGSTTYFDEPYAAAVDKNGQLYVLSDYGVNVYATPSTATSATVPAATIYGTNTGITSPVALTVDSAGSIYVANGDTSTTGSVRIFAAASNGNVTPLRTITYSSGSIMGVAVDSSLNLWAAEEALTSSGASNVQLALYPAGATGAATPTKTITGAATGLTYAGMIATDKVNNVYALNYNFTRGTFQVLGFAPSVSGNVAPGFTTTVGALTNPSTFITVR
ncbi:hypothetical protein ACFQBQ_10865 [Granulicella cerasi]|uniref:NHL repeat containing protein n=1 Tax=Granulicella cerasi TaxID=741063 RepID=A0ABW1ZBV2_9BACT|nr:hypothetical protein [Granulicella cerasi]